MEELQRFYDSLTTNIISSCLAGFKSLTSCIWPGGHSLPLPGLSTDKFCFSSMCVCVWKSKTKIMINQYMAFHSEVNKIKVLSVKRCSLTFLCSSSKLLKWKLEISSPGRTLTSVLFLNCRLYESLREPL